jgi:S-(hydroxymethyl)glutathione dehydrogenase/alcohol dehydrogenase
MNPRIMPSSTVRRTSRRAWLKSSTAAALGSALIAPGTSAEQARRAAAVLKNPIAGRRFRGYVRYGTGGRVEDLRLLPIQPRQVLVRTEAVVPCYTISAASIASTPAPRAEVPNHSGVGVVEAVGSLVKRVQPGDRVIVAGTSECGQCYQCLHGRPDYCQFTFTAGPWPPFAELSDGTPVIPQAGLGGFSEFMTVFEEYCCPVFTDVPPAQLALLGDQLVSGFAAGFAEMRMEPGSDVAIFGAGPVGIGAVQAARVASADQIIVVEPIAYRREFARKMGATATLDPRVEGDGLVERIREMTKGPTDRLFAGGRTWAPARPPFGLGRGVDFAVEAAGVQRYPPAVETQPDPTGLLPMHQAWDCTTMGGHVMLMGFAEGDLAINAGSLALFGRTIHPGQQGGFHMMRDLPRYVKLIEKGRLDAQSMITKTYSLEDIRRAIQDVAERSVMVAAVTFPT